MNTEIFDLALIDRKLMPAESALSFQPFITYLQELIEDQPLKKALFENIISKFSSELSGRDQIRIGEAAQYKELLELIYILLNPLVSNATKHVWALSTPIPGEIFFSTDTFHDFHTSEKFGVLSGDFETKNILSGNEKGFIYQLILRRFYNIDFSIYSDNHIQGLNPQTLNPVFYKIHIDTRFLDISYSGNLPDLDVESVQSWLLDAEGEQYLEKLLPLPNFKIRGFSILEFTDVTEEHAIENLKNIIADYKESVFSEGLNETLQSLVGRRNLRFGILPFIKLNNRAVYRPESSTNSILMNAALRYKIREEVYHQPAEQYEQMPQELVYNNITPKGRTKDPFLKSLRYAGIQSYALLPVVYLKKIVGVLEVYSNEKVLIDQSLLSRLQEAIPYIGQLFNHISVEFAENVEQAVTDNFTSIKSSVKWKFNEVVWTQLKNADDILTAEIGKISFSDLYPFYGAIDIRQSTLERNNAVFADIVLQMDMLEQMFESLPAVLPVSLCDILLLRKAKWLRYFQNFRDTGDEISIHNLIREEIEPFLLQAAGANPEANERLIPYIRSTSEEQGIIYKNRRELEASMHIVNDSIDQYLTRHQKKLQKTFPHYFDKFRTDGVEYDIYLGQSIAPYRKLTPEHVQNMRLWQLKSMVEIGLITRKLQHRLSRPLQTTQLIFIHSSPVTIGFRQDEKRFDVEGPYSVRYEVVKKRIDKVLIMGTGERLTQPEKIALVYFSQQEEDEYLHYIATLQSDGYLTGDIDFLKLEDLQGVHGLKALRVSIA